MTNIITTNHLSKQYNRIYRVKDLDLSIPEGSVYGFLGPNGAGKSTTMKMLLGLTRPSQGEITILGTKMNQKNRLSILKNTGSLIEAPSYYGHLSGKENLQIIQTLKSADKKDIDRVLHIVRLENQKDKLVNHYSLGMKQRLGLACALIGNPKLLILDEPTNGLDPAGIQEMRELICSLPQQYGITVMVSSHLLSEIDQMAVCVGIISKGELVYQDSLENLHAKSHHKIALKTLDNKSAAALLQKKRIPFEMEEDYLILPKLSDGQIASCSIYLAEQGIGIIRMEERQKTLEDIFLELTGTAVSL